MSTENITALKELICQMNAKQLAEFMKAVKQRYCIDEKIGE